MPERGGRFETIVATFVGLLALAVSAYTAYMQRQQVRAQVWPIVVYSTSNEPTLRLTIANKGPGPAIIKHVIVTVDGEPLKRWYDVLQKLLGPGEHKFAESDIHDRVLAAGEELVILEPREAAGPLTYDKPGSPGDLFNRGRSRIGVDICYCSTLGDCWTLHGAQKDSTTSETKRCPARAEISFSQ